MTSRSRSAVRSFVLGGLVALGGCERHSSPSPAPSPSDVSERSPSTDSGTSVAPTPKPLGSNARLSFGDAVRSLSERDQPFFSENYVSNETSYLHVANGLAQRAELAGGGAYVGVGPEQSFSYIALLRPKVAYIVDIRRQNLVLHLLYKAIFQRATSRSHFLALLTGRPYEPSTAPRTDASIEDVIRHSERRPYDEQTFLSLHRELLAGTEGSLGAALDANDRARFLAAHRAFAKGQLDLSFELHEKNGRLYPKLRDLLTATDLDGRQRGFLATEEAFRFVQSMQNDGSVIPVVGDFAGDRALASVAMSLRERGLTVRAFYVSNVEQYLFENGVWAKWVRNVGLLPTDEHSVFVRAYLDQGKPHPRQRPHHRTATLLQRIDDFKARQGGKRPYAGFWDLSTDACLD